jgi:hypothetical protein
MWSCWQIEAETERFLLSFPHGEGLLLDTFQPETADKTGSRKCRDSDICSWDF